MKIADSQYQACLYFTSNALARKTERLAAAAWKPLGMAPSHGYLLLLTLDQPGITAGAVASQLLLAPSTVTRLVEKLEEAGLLRRTPEGKTTLLHPTEKAIALRPDMEAAIKSFIASFTANVDLPHPADLIASIKTAHDALPE